MSLNYNKQKAALHTQYAVEAGELVGRCEEAILQCSFNDPP